MANQDMALMAHLMRRAGFGVPYQELEARAAKGYQATVEELLEPGTQPEFEMDLFSRYYTDYAEIGATDLNEPYLAYRMINTKRPLEEKMALLWHGIFCVGNTKCDHGWQVLQQLEKFRRHGMGSFRDLLTVLAQDPSMIFYLDNCMSHKGAINENWGRELLELFALGVGMDSHPNYTEEDVKVCARAFTGWTVTNGIPVYPYGMYEAHFVYYPQDHDESEKSFLGEIGRFNGEDVIDIIARQPATARFVSRHLYNFFVADETQVPSWKDTSPRDPEAIKMLEDEYFRSNYDIRSMLRVLFNSDRFKKARFQKVKSPTEAVVGAVRLVGDFSVPRPGLHPLAIELRIMGQELMNPPTVEGWHTGAEWIDSGTLLERINFAAEQVGNTQQPGVQDIIQRMAAEGPVIAPKRLVDGCLEMVGCYELSPDRRSELVAHAEKGGELRPDSDQFARRLAEILQLIVASPEYQFA